MHLEKTKQLKQRRIYKSLLALLNLDQFGSITRMCGGPEQKHVHAPHAEKESPFKGKMSSTSNVKKKSDYEEILNSSSCLLELAANDDFSRFRRCVEEKKFKVDEVGVWYVRHNGTSQMVLEQRTPAMVAALYGSMDVLTYILNLYAIYGGDIDQACGSDGSTAVHCAAAGGSVRAIQVVKLLLKAGANVNMRDSEGRRPADVIAVSFGNAVIKKTLEELLNKHTPLGISAEHGSSMGNGFKDCFVPLPFDNVGLSSFDVLHMKSSSSSSALSTASGASTLSISLSASSSPKSPATVIARGAAEDGENMRDYSIDTSLPDIKNIFYTSDEFRMYSFKIRPCSRAYSHDWTECPFAHPGENARRRDPRRYHYSCVPCPDFRKGACSHGDACEYAHGVFECWLHPAQYRTRLCKDGVECNRKVCFFAHMAEELRPVYASTGSGLPSPMSASFTDMSCRSPPLAPCSPSVMPPYSPLHPLQSTLQGSMRTPPMSPASSPSNAAWPQPSIPTLHLPGASLQSSRLRAAFTARDASTNSDFDEQLVNEIQSLSAHSLSTQARLNAAVAASANGSTSSRSGRYKSLGLTVAPANLEELFALESMPSPGISAREVPLFAHLERTSPQKQLHGHAQGSAIPSPRESFFNLGSLSGASKCNKGPRVEGQGINKGAVSPALVAARAALSQGNKGSRSSRDLGAGFVWSDWGSPTGKPEWGMQEDDLSKLRKSASFQMRGSEEPDVSWVQKLVKEGPLENDAGVPTHAYYENGRGDTYYENARGGNVPKEGADLLMSASWIDNLCLDQIAA